MIVCVGMEIFDGWTLVVVPYIEDIYYCIQGTAQGGRVAQARYLHSFTSTF